MRENRHKQSWNHEALTGYEAQKYGYLLSYVYLWLRFCCVSWVFILLTHGNYTYLWGTMLNLNTCIYWEFSIQGTMAVNTGVILIRQHMGVPKLCSRLPAHLTPRPPNIYSGPKALSSGGRTGRSKWFQLCMQLWQTCWWRNRTKQPSTSIHHTTEGPAS